MYLILLSLLYMSLVFALAFYVERRKGSQAWVAQPWVYSLGLGVYCTAWTFYGSVGRAAEEGWNFLAIYLGPSLLMPLWWRVMSKLSRVVKAQGLSSLADVLSLRYGKSSTLGFVVTLGSLFGITPYIALQIKAIAQSSAVMQGQALSFPPFWQDSIFYYCLIIALFSMSFGVQRVEANHRRPAMVAGIAFESAFKLLSFLVLGVWVIWGLFGSPKALLEAAEAAQVPVAELLDTRPLGLDWLLINLLSALAFWLLPRQFHLGVIEQRQEKQLRQAAWQVPLYFLLINLFVLPLALAGLSLGLSGSGDMWILEIPLSQGREGLALLAYLGGFAAATSMVIVSTTALSIMLSNNLLLPLGLRLGWLKTEGKGDWVNKLLWLRRWSILGIILMAYLYYELATQNRSLINIGLNSFVAIAQFAPALLLGLYWKRSDKGPVLWGLGLGFGLWFMSLILPVFAQGTALAPYLFDAAGQYKLWAFMDLGGLSPVASTFVWSMFLNIGAIVLLAKPQPQDPEVRRQAQLFVEAERYLSEDGQGLQSLGTAAWPDIQALLQRFLGSQHSEQALARYARLQGLDLSQQDQADPQLLAFAERLLTGAIGASSAQILLRSVLRHEPIEFNQVMLMLEESRQVIELNKQLKQQSRQLARASQALEEANEKLRQANSLKEEFLYTVTHELRTPLTSIRAFSEILHDEPDMAEAERQHFLGLMIEELERLSRLISTVLDLEKYESGNQSLELQRIDMPALIRDCMELHRPLLEQRGLSLRFDLRDKAMHLEGDRDKLQQLLTNLLGNALKYAQKEIVLSAYLLDGQFRLRISDDGPGIAPELRDKIFDKFYQIKADKQGGSPGSGLGLAISQKIAQLHGGKLWVEEAQNGGAKFGLNLPLTPNS